MNDDTGGTSKDNNGLAIGAFETVFCADTGATYVYKICKKIKGKDKNHENPDVHYHKYDSPLLVENQYTQWV